MPVFNFPRRHRAAIALFTLVSIAGLLYVNDVLRLLTFGSNKGIDDSEENPTTLELNDVLLVSSFYPKRTPNPHFVSQTRSSFLGQIKTDMYIYTSQEHVQLVSSLRDGLPMSVDTRYTSGFSIPPLQSRKADYEGLQDGRILNTEMSAQDNARPFFLAEALRMVQKEGSKVYKYAFWVDYDVFQGDHIYKYWPNSGRVDELWAIGRREGGARLEDMFFLPMANLPRVELLLWKEQLGPIGGHIMDGMMKSAINKRI